MYTATILNSLIEKGVLSVTVKFNDDNGNEFQDTFTTSQKQNPGWIESQITKKLLHLDALPGLKNTIVDGKTITSESAAAAAKAELVKDAEREEYKADHLRFEKFVAAIAKGFTSKENAEFVALKKKLTDNFKTDYLDLF